MEGAGAGAWRGGRDLLSRRRGALAVVAEQRRRARPGAVHQQQAEAQRPRAHGRQEEGRGAVRLQEEVARVRLPGEQQQHEDVDRQGPPAAARPQEVGAEGVAAAALVEAPAQVGGEGHVEEEELRERAACLVSHVRGVTAGYNKNTFLVLRPVKTCALFLVYKNRFWKL